LPDSGFTIIEIATKGKELHIGSQLISLAVAYREGKIVSSMQ
jgi:hypothetical protein